MRIGVVHTVGSICRCADAIADGIRALGHEPVPADSEQMESLAWDLARGCDLIIDHTDTFRGRGLYRALVRMLLESRGGRVVGSDGKACLLADDKAAAKARLAAAGIPTAPGIVVTGEGWSIPSWVTPPWVLKPAFEHMSRGLRLARSEQEARRMAADLLGRFHQPLLMETFLPGRELAVPVLAAPGGPDVLPVVEMRAAERPGVLTEEFKRVEFHGVREDAAPADLTPSQQALVEELARKAFEAMGLRDYARFDVRLSPGGVFYFLEANTTPSMEPFEAFALSARWAGLEYPAVIQRMLASALHRYGGLPASKSFEIRLPTGAVELELPSGVHLPPDSSVELARLLDVQAGEDVLELGCGCGLIAIAAAKRGARRVVATDMDPASLAATEANARRNRVADRIQIRAGSWYEALGPEGGKGSEERFHVVIATPPQTPGPVHFGPKYGGKEGTRHLFAAVDGAGAFLDPGRGRLWLLAVSLADTKALWERLRQRFEEVTLVKETPRLFTREEYEALHPGLFDYLLALREAGCSDFEEVERGVYGFRNLLIRARRPRPS